MHCQSPLLVAVAALALGGCDKQADSGPKSMEQAKEEATKLERPRPGQYRQSITITRFEMPNAPPQAVAQIKQAMEQQQQGSFCLTAEKAQDGFRDMFQEVGKNGECKYDRFEVDGGRLDAALDCKAANQGSARIVLAGNVTPEGSDVTVDVDQDDPGNPMGKARIGMRMTSQRTGDCATGR